MKRLLSIILLAVCFINFTGVNAFCAPARKKVLKTGITKNIKKEKPKPEDRDDFQIPTFEDDTALELAKRTDKSLHKKPKYNETLIADEPVLMSTENRKFKNTVYTGKVSTEFGEEVILKPIYKVSTKNAHIKVPQGKKYDKYKVALPFIGERIPFKVMKDVKKGDKVIIKKDTVVYAKIAEVSPRAMGGAPAEMTIEQFEIKDEKGNIKPLDGTISSSGYSLSFWIGVAELATTPFLFGLAVPLLRLLPGGQAVVSPRKSYIVYY